MNWYCVYKSQEEGYILMKIPRQNVLGGAGFWTCDLPTQIFPKCINYTSQSNVNQVPELSLYSPITSVETVETVETVTNVETITTVETVSNYSFISGSRDNVGRKGSDHVTEAVYVGAVGARFERRGQMEYQDIVITRSQNIPGENKSQTWFFSSTGMCLKLCQLHSLAPRISKLAYLREMIHLEVLVSKDPLVLRKVWEWIKERSWRKVEEATPSWDFAYLRPMLCHLSYHLSRFTTLLLHLAALDEVDWHYQASADCSKQSSQ